MSTTTVGARLVSLSRSAGAILLGFIAILVLARGAEDLVHWLREDPPRLPPMSNTSLSLLALSYWIVSYVAGGYLAARLAPSYPMRHAMILGFIEFVYIGAAAYSAIVMFPGAAWDTTVLAISALPSAWLGGVLHRAWHPSR